MKNWDIEDKRKTESDNPLGRDDGHTRPQPEPAEGMNVKDSDFDLRPLSRAGCRRHSSSNLARIKRLEGLLRPTGRYSGGRAGQQRRPRCRNGNRAIGRCTLELTTGLGLCTFSDGIGRSAGFTARVQVSPPSDEGDDWHWEGTYSFSSLD